MNSMQVDPNWGNISNVPEPLAVPHVMDFKDHFS